MIADWLLTAVITIVTTYTQPGQRVLLLDPAPFIALPAAWPATAVQNRPRRSPYAGLLEAGWTVVRLGRGIQSRTVGAHPDPCGETPGATSTESESGPSLPTASPSTGDATGPSPDRPAGPDTPAPGHSPDRFDLIITAAEPRALDWFHPTDWAGLLAQTGTLAVITHGDHSGGRLTDPAGPLVHTAHHTGLRFTDRIALLRVPVHNGTLTVADAGAYDRSQTLPGPSTKVHDDLFVFTRQPLSSGDVNGEEPSDD
ncbi:hypothetical protein [Kutzneria albida]|uniref:Uncharacterized protein n=1 Tax=Kutzneria albida DSM 43870 TaxID=1449976 RepID=W5WK19_9PSEU|nr:hypothetical protein [Kutzneria albida]AHH98524.1 hypothetical protein KALB_5162 [Kutzneria albida DSM 43870]